MPNQRQCREFLRMCISLARRRASACNATGTTPRSGDGANIFDMRSNGKGRGGQHMRITAASLDMAYIVAQHVLWTNVAFQTIAGRGISGRFWSSMQ